MGTFLNPYNIGFAAQQYIIVNKIRSKFLLKDQVNNRLIHDQFLRMLEQELGMIQWSKKYYLCQRQTYFDSYHSLIQLIINLVTLFASSKVNVRSTNVVVIHYLITIFGIYTEYLKVSSKSTLKKWRMKDVYF